MTDPSSVLMLISVLALPILLAITLHEAAHGYVAWRCGDSTAYMLGRVSLNPLRHIDPFGTVILPAVLFYTTGFIFGYAKPVPVNYRNLRNPRRDMVLVAAAGPGANLLIALSAGLLSHLVGIVPEAGKEFVILNLHFAILFNVMLALFNMLPIPPLDGGRVAVGLLPRPLAMRLAALERHGLLVLIFLLLIAPMLGNALNLDLNILGWILGPASDYLTSIIHLVTGWQWS